MMRLDVTALRAAARQRLVSLARGPVVQSAGLPILTRLTGLPLLGSWLHHPVGVLALACGQPALAAAECEAALAGGRAWTRSIHRHLGKAQLGLGRLEAAERSLVRAAEQAPADRHNRLWLAETLLRQDRATEAETLLRGLLGEGMQRRWPHLMLVHALLRQDRAGAAIDHLIDAASRPGANLDEIPFPEYLLSLQVATRERSEALKPIVEHHPKHRELVTFQARLLSWLGDYGTATWLSCRALGVDRQALTRAIGGAFKPPAFLIIGQAKAGTTSLFDWLSRHPDISPPLVKEIHYWSQFRDADMAWYRAHFPLIPAASRCISGEASTTYLTYPTAPVVIARDLPEVRVICLLRDPVRRAFSEFQMFSRLGWERRGWEQVVAAELGMLGDCPLEVAEFDEWQARGCAGYLLHSAALPALRRWSGLFPPEQLLIIDSAELFADSAAAVARVFRYLGLPGHRLGAVAPVNAGHYPSMAPDLAQRLRDWFAPHQQALETFLNELHT